MVYVEEVVAQALRDGHLYGARPHTASKTLTVEGKRRIRIRLQSDIFRAVYDPHALASDAYYPDIFALIRTAVLEQRQ